MQCTRSVLVSTGYIESVPEERSLSGSKECISNVSVRRKSRCEECVSSVAWSVSEEC